jgi:hypothetical protein
MMRCLADRKSFFWMSYEVLVSLKKRELYVMRRKMRKAKAISDLERTTLMEEVSWRQN